MERKYLNAGSLIFSMVLLILLLLKFIITNPGHWEIYDYFFKSNFGFLASGESYRSSAFQFRIHHSWISVTILQTLDEICDRPEKVAIPEPNDETLKQTVDGFQ
jgi:hypothetical protein